MRHSHRGTGVPFSAALLSLALCQAAPIHAAETEELSEVTVTGSRIANVGMAAPTPVTAVSLDELSTLSPGTLVSALSQLPQFYGNTTSDVRTGFFSSPGEGNLNLRGLNTGGSGRTLTLLDGRRVVPATGFGSVDINILPAGAHQARRHGHRWRLGGVRHRRGGRRRQLHPRHELHGLAGECPGGHHESGRPRQRAVLRGLRHGARRQGAPAGQRRVLPGRPGEQHRGARLVPGLQPHQQPEHRSVDAAVPDPPERRLVHRHVRRPHQQRCADELGAVSPLLQSERHAVALRAGRGHPRRRRTRSPTAAAATTPPRT